MKVLLNEQGYIESYALEGELLDAVEVSAPSNLAHFEAHFTAYRVRDGTLSFDGEQAALEQSEAAKAEYRKRREVECFPIINRGQLWYDTLSAAQLADRGSMVQIHWPFRRNRRGSTEKRRSAECLFYFKKGGQL